MEKHAAIQSRNRLELTKLLGIWVNANQEVDFIEGFKLGLNDRGDLQLRGLSVFRHSASTQLCLDVHPVAGPGSKLAAGFYSCRQSGLILAANEKNGVLVLQSYRQEDGLLTREFYYRYLGRLTGETVSLPGHIPLKLSPAGGQIRENDASMENFHALTGCWHNTNSETPWMKAFSVAKHDPAWMLEVYGEFQGIAWPPMALTPYHFDSREIGFSACCQLGEVMALFCAYSNKGLMVVTIFFTDNSAGKRAEADVFCREFYAKQALDEVTGC